MKKKKDEITIRSSAAEYLTYVASVGDQQDSIELRYENENIWLTQKMMATLYDIGLPTINEHIKKIYADSELEESATIRNFRIVQTEGSRQVTRDTKHYNLQMISDVQRILELKPTRSSALLREMVEHGIIEAVAGYGKGKYRFRK